MYIHVHIKKKNESLSRSDVFGPRDQNYVVKIVYYLDTSRYKQGASPGRLVLAKRIHPEVRLYRLLVGPTGIRTHDPPEPEDLIPGR